MADLTALNDPIVTAIYEQYEKRESSELARPYIGASVIGKECKRALWYAFRWASKESFDGRMLRLFQTGHLEEPRMVADLRAIGATVYDVNPADGKQFGFIGHGGHARGHMDGCAQGIPGGGRKWHVLEFKTHSAKSFATLKKDGVQKAKPEHYAQMTWYMGKSGMERALYLAKNKDTDDLYSERIEFDRVAFEQIEAKFDSIIFAAEPPPKISEDAKFYLCNWCSHNAVCHGHRVPAVSCRTCVHATPERMPENEGRWSCAKAGSDSSIPLDAQRTGCAQHLPLPFLLTYAEAIDAGEGWIEFKRKDNNMAFIVATHKEAIPSDVVHRYTSVPPVYSTQEVSAVADHRVICAPEIENLKTQFGGTLVG